MDKKQILAFLILAVLILVIGLIFAKLPTPKSQISSTIPPVSNQLLEKTDDGAGGVTVTAKYELDKSEKEIIFTISLDTHSGDISGWDYIKNISIKTSDGKIFSPLPESQIISDSSHHRSFLLKFKAPITDESAFILSVTNLNGIPNRIFKWTR